MSAAICPHCGYDLARDEPIEIGRFRFDWRDGLFFEGRPIHLTPQCKALVQGVMKAGGEPLSAVALAERVGIDEVSDPTNHVAVLMTRARRVITSAGAPDCIHNVRNVGWFWKEPAEALR